VTITFKAPSEIEGGPEAQFERREEEGEGSTNWRSWEVTVEPTERTCPIWPVTFKTISRNFFFGVSGKLKGKIEIFHASKKKKIVYTSRR
jgi:hypothetical protein